jgi:hypothetical protein
MEGVFVDTGGWYALADADDRHHEAVRNWMAQNTCPLVTTDYVFDEIVTLIRQRRGHRGAVRFGEKLRSSALTRIISVTPGDREAAWRIFKKFKDQRFSFTDCTSFAVMKRLGLSQVLTVDQHFRVMGFVLVI